MGKSSGGETLYRRQTDCGCLFALVLLASCLQQTQAVTDPEDSQFVVDPQILATRLRIYDQVIQALAIQTAREIGQGVITTVPPLPFGQGKTTQEVVRVDVRGLQLNGFTFNEFYLPPGTQVGTTETEIILSYQRFVLSNAPVGVPPGFEVVSPVVRLTAFPISSLTDPAARPLVLSAPPRVPITVTFLIPVTDASCATFNASGQIALVTTQVSPAKTVCDTGTIGTFTLTTVPAPPPGIAPAPAPAVPPAVVPSLPPSAAPALPPGAPEAAPSPLSPNEANPPPGQLSPPPGVLSPPSPPIIAPYPPPGPEPEAAATASNTGLIVGLAVGLGVPFLILAAVGIWYAWRAVARGRLEGMEKESDKRASLETAIVGGSRAPAAGALRTRPYLESEDPTTDRI